MLEAGRVCRATKGGSFELSRTIVDPPLKVVSRGLDQVPGKKYIIRVKCASSYCRHCPLGLDKFAEQNLGSQKKAILAN